MDNFQLESILSRDTYVGPYFRGVYSRDTLPVKSRIKSKRAYIVNTDPSDLPGEHWIAIYIDEYGRGLYFDSSGVMPLHREFYEFMNRSTTSWTFNHTKLQGNHTLVCGAYCVYILLNLFRNKSLQTILSAFDNNYDDNDVQIYDFITSRYGLYDLPFM